MLSRLFQNAVAATLLSLVFLSILAFITLSSEPNANIHLPIFGSALSISSLRIVSVIITMGAIFIQAVIFNFIFNRYDLLDEKNHSTLFILPLFYFLFNPALFNPSITYATLFLLPAYLMVFQEKIGQVKEESLNMYLVGMFTALSTLFSSVCIILMPVLFVIKAIHGPFTLRIAVSYLLGWFSIVFIAVNLLFLTDRWDLVQQAMQEMRPSFSQFNMLLQPSFYLPFGIFILLAIPGFFVIYPTRSGINARRRIDSIRISFVILLLLSTLNIGSNFDSQSLLAPFIAFLVVRFIFIIKNWFFQDFALLLLIALTVGVKLNSLL